MAVDSATFYEGRETVYVPLGTFQVRHGRLDIELRTREGEWALVGGLRLTPLTTAQPDIDEQKEQEARDQLRSLGYLD